MRGFESHYPCLDFHEVHRHFSPNRRQPTSGKLIKEPSQGSVGFPMRVQLITVKAETKEILSSILGEPVNAQAGYKK